MPATKNVIKMFLLKTLESPPPTSFGLQGVRQSLSPSINYLTQKDLKIGSRSVKDNNLNQTIYEY